MFRYLLVFSRTLTELDVGDGAVGRFTDELAQRGLEILLELSKRGRLGGNHAVKVTGTTLKTFCRNPTYIHCIIQI